MFAKLFTFTGSFVFFLAACVPANQITTVPTTDLSLDPSETPVPTIFSEETVTPQSSRTPRPTATEVTLQLQKIEELPSSSICTDFDQSLPSKGLIQVAYLPSGLCFHGELDVFEIGGNVYVAQVIMSRFPNAEEAFRIVDVTNAEQPSLIGAWKWNIPTYSADIKAFRQGDRWFLALSRDPSSVNMDERLCSLIGGIAIIEVTEPTNPTFLGILTGESTGSRAKWCNSHTAEVSRDASGNGIYLYVSAIDIFDLRVLDIGDLANVSEVGHYTHPDAGFYNERNIFFVHDTTIVDDRVYVAYWSAGLIILDRQALESGKRVTPLNPLDSIDPWGLQIHQAFPTTDGKFVFVEDEFPSKQPESRLRLYDIRDLQSPKEVAAITLPNSLGAPHNMLISGDQLFVGWYQDGVQVFRFDTSDPEDPSVEQEAFQAVRTRTTFNPGTGIFDGIWGVRLHECVVAGQPMTCVYASDITYGLIILAIEP